RDSHATRMSCRERAKIVKCGVLGSAQSRGSAACRNEVAAMLAQYGVVPEARHFRIRPAAFELGPLHAGIAQLVGERVEEQRVEQQLALFGRSPPHARLQVGQAEVVFGARKLDTGVKVA